MIATPGPAATDLPHGQRVAIVGAGISGLVCAYLLRRHHEITVFEANDYVGGHTHTPSMEARVQGSGETTKVAVDSGFIVFNETNYPNFTRLLQQLGVES